MLLSTRDAQRERRSSLVLAATAIADRLSLGGIDNVSFQDDSGLDRQNLSRTSSSSAIQSNTQQTSDVQTDHQVQNITFQEENISPDSKKKQKKRYRWKMTHYFYIHVALFIFNGFFCGLIVYLIENHSSVRNRQMNVPYVDAWFVASSCVYNCGLTTVDFAKLSRASQIVLMVFTFISGITISTLPALVVKAHSHRRAEGLTVDDDYDDLDDDEQDNDLPTVNIRSRRNLPEHIKKKLASLPTAAQLRYRAYITCIALILSTCFVIYIVVFCAIGSWLSTQYTPDQLLQGNQTVNPWFISFIVTITGFNQNGLAPFSDGFSRFVYDVFLNLFVMLVVMCGTSLFPFLLRNVILLIRRLSSSRHQVIFDYILMNNHRLSTLLFPALQTRIYLSVTALLYITGVSICLILDFNSQNFTKFSPGTRFLIFLFHTVNSRFAGFQTVDINLFASATLLVFLMLMATKPQMLCAIDESPFEIAWLAIEAKEEINAKTNSAMNIEAGGLSREGSIMSGSSGGHGIPIRSVHQFLRRQSYVTKDRARQQFANTVKTNGEKYRPTHIRRLRLRLFLIYFIRALIKHTFSFIILTRTWLFVFIFLICAIEYRRMAPIDPEITVFKIIFEIISAFGAVGLTLGYPNVSSSFATVLSPASKAILVITMLMGRHRGLLASMKDQEAIEYSAADLLERKREEIISKCEETEKSTKPTEPTQTEVLIVRF